MSGLTIGPVLDHQDELTPVELILRQAVHQPDRLAVTDEKVALSYRDLDILSVDLADRLVDCGVREGDLVPLLLPNGISVPVAMLAVMRAGAAFVPLDPRWPVLRLRQVLDDLRAPVVVSSAEPTGQHLFPGEPTLSVDITAPVVGERTRQRGADCPSGLDDLIYGFFTSGSTGTPKCALNHHRGLRNRFAHMSRRFGSSPDDVVLQNSSHVFDSSIWQLLWPLTKGASVVIPERSGLADLEATISCIDRFGVTMTDYVPSVFNVLVDFLAHQPEQVQRLSSLRHLLIGGEEMLAGPVHRFRQMLPATEVTNTYGPTEASIGMVFHAVTDADSDRIPLGRPIPNTWARILDEDRQPLGKGVTGRLWIGGECVGAGYHGDAERTAKTFVTNPFPDLMGARMYDTGDLGFVGDDGLLHYRGRADEQVKVAGSRVELGEVEAALNSCSGVSDCKATTYVDAVGVRRLAAFVTSSGPELSAADLTLLLRDRLPAGSVPTRLLVVDEIPRNSNGKADRRQLAERAAAFGPSSGSTIPLATPREVVRDAWARLVPTTPDSSGNFFSDGGDSLTALRLTMLVNDTLGSSLSVRDVVRTPTLEGLVRLLLDGEVTQSARELDAQRAHADSLLPEDITPGAAVVRRGPRRALLTGATGFVGAHLLHHLLRYTDASIHCLVRADDAESAMDRLHEALAHYRLDATEMHRVVPVLGDLTRSRLGLTDHVWAELSATMEVIIHNGARVNMILGYADHRGANVDGTVELLRLASAGSATPFHLVSTLGAADPGDAGRENPPAADPPQTGGYCLSKWVSERLVAQAADRGLPVAVYRLGEVMPHSVTGVPSPDSLTDMFLRWNLRLGVATTSSIVLNYSPVDAASTLVCSGAVNGATGWFHLAETALVPLDLVLREFAHEFDLHRVSYREFWTRLSKVAPEDEMIARDQARLLALLPPAPALVTECEVESSLRALFAESARPWQGAAAAALMRRSGTAVPAVGVDVLRRYAAHHRRTRLAPRRARGLVG